jgi:excisionase family DNA binding protein
MKKIGEYVSVSEAAKRLCVCPDTIRKWVDAGKLKAYVTPTRHRKILAEDIDRILKGNLSL